MWTEQDQRKLEFVARAVRPVARMLGDAISARDWDAVARVHRDLQVIGLRGKATAAEVARGYLTGKEAETIERI